MSRIRKPSRRVAQYMIFIYGPTGVGKTTLTATMPGRGLIIDTVRYEGGTEVIAHHRDRIDIVSVYSWADLQKLYHALRTGKLVYDWVAIDSATGVMQLARRKVKREEQRDPLEPPYKVTLPNYGTMGDLMTVFFEEFRSLPMPVILLAQERETEDEESGAVLTLPDISPKSYRSLKPHPKLAGYLFVARDSKGRWERRLRVGVNPAYYTKVRAIEGRRLPDIIRRPDLGQIVAYMSGDKVERPRGIRDNEAPEAASGNMD